ncbi:MAG TPA: phosphoenolpyruvate synthase [Candidatus Pacearchaeota archaeon]|nr:phosphoenolpyruvate synthase [Candidatus Pacearchaeota archaeon]
MSTRNIIWINDLRKSDVAIVGGKNASMGEMFSQLTPRGIRIPNAFALTADAYWTYLKHNGFDEKLAEIYRTLDPKNVAQTQAASRRMMNLVLTGKFPKNLEAEILANYAQLSREYGEAATDVSVRSSSTAEDLPTASFAGQHETFLNIRGEKKLLLAIKNCIASLFTARAIAYRDENKFDHMQVALSVLVQKMVRSDLGASGVMFTLDTETGFRDVVLINAIYGLGELIVKGKITPDTFYVFKPTLKKGYASVFLKNLGRKNTKYVYNLSGGWKEIAVPLPDQQKFAIDENEILTLARWACEIEEHYGRPQDLEWAKDGKTGELFIVQSRPETIHAKTEGNFYEEYTLQLNGQKEIISGIAVGNKIGQGTVRIIDTVEKIAEFKPGEVLVTKMTDPDWVPIMRIASAIITNEGGTTSHAAIVSRELGIPCVVGTKTGTQIIPMGQDVTVDCSHSRIGKIYSGKIPFSTTRYDLKKIPNLPVKISLNIGTPDSAFKYSSLPVSGVGLAREEFIISEKIKIHPLALIKYDEIKDQKIKRQIDDLTIGYDSKIEFYINELAEGISQIAAAFYPREVIVRFSDFKTNEYETLIGGTLFEPKEENPMIGWRGASRYYDERFLPAFKLELDAINRARNIYGLNNISVMIPFCRTPEEARKVTEIIEQNGLKRGQDGLKLYIMCEIPSNVIRAEDFLPLCDGFSIGSNDLTQCLMGMDRDNPHIAPIANENNETVKKMIAEAVAKCNAMGKYSGICGDAPSTLDDFAKFLVDSKIQSISLSPDAVIKTIMRLDSIINHKNHV